MALYTQEAILEEVLTEVLLQGRLGQGHGGQQRDASACVLPEEGVLHLSVVSRDRQEPQREEPLVHRLTQQADPGRVLNLVYRPRGSVTQDWTLPRGPGSL